MTLAKTIILKTTLACNLRCSYCYEFGAQGHSNDYGLGHQSIENVIAVLERMARLLPGSAFLLLLHGGEPLTMPFGDIQSLLEAVRKLNSEQDIKFRIALQTNGTLLSKRWIRLLEENQDLFSERIVSISIDGPKLYNDLARRALNSNSAYDETMRAIEFLRESTLDYTTISVVGTHNVDHPDEVYRFIRDLNPRVAKFIPCYNFDINGAPEKYGITPLEYAGFMRLIFDQWVRDLPGSHDIPLIIEPIATILAKMVDAPVAWCEYRDEKCDSFVSIYPNGEGWLCDNYDLQTSKPIAYIGNLFTLTDEELRDALATPQIRCRYEKFYDFNQQTCVGCDVKEYCCGGCLPIRERMRSAKPELCEEYCTGKRSLIHHIQGAYRLAMSQS